jgi:hypothetical protein
MGNFQTKFLGQFWTHITTHNNCTVHKAINGLTHVCDKSLIMLGDSRPIKTRQGCYKTESSPYEHVNKSFCIKTSINRLGCDAVSPIEPQWRFGGDHCLSVQRREYAKQPTRDREAVNLLCSCDRLWIFTGLYCVTSSHGHCCESVRFSCTDL